MIIGENVLIRTVEEEDMPQIYEWSMSFELKKYFSFTIDFTDYENICKSIETADAYPDSVYFGIVEKEEKKLIGMCMLKDIDYADKRCICYIYIGDREYRGRGYGEEALNLLMRYAFLDLNLNRIGMWVASFNKHAIKCFKKCGFKVEGIMPEWLYRDGKYHDMYFMGMLKNQYQEIVKGGSEKCSEENM